MQPQNSNDQCASESHPNGGRDSERSASFDAAIMACWQAINLAYRPVHLAEPGKPLNLIASISGRGGLQA
jgi:hypothetical protein